MRNQASSMITGITSYSSRNFSDVELGRKELSSEVSNYTSVIIGENGSGKTRLLNELISTNRKIVSDEPISKNSPIKIEFLNNHKKIKLQKIVAISTSYNDKLPFSDNDKFFDEYYQYCGIRETSNASWSSSLMRKTLDNLLHCIEKNQSIKVNEIFNFLGLSNDFRITFSLKKKRSLDLEKCTPEELVQYVKSYYMDSSRMLVEKMAQFDHDMANSIISDFLPIIESDKKERYIEIKISNKTEGVTDIFSNLDILRRVGIINNVRLTLSRKDKSLKYAYIDASSGEAQLLFSMTAFLRYVTDNSLVIIDEPEISLHPNWQIKYFSLLNLLLEKLSGCHIIIATHSHFLVSELNPKSSSLISLRNVEGAVKAESILSSTLGWSPESILYRVFNVRTFNSIYLENDLQKAHSIITNNKTDSIEELNKLNEKFKSLVLDETDPLNSFITAVQGYINDNH